MTISDNRFHFFTESDQNNYWIRPLWHFTPVLPDRVGCLGVVADHEWKGPPHSDYNTRNENGPTPTQSNSGVMLCLLNSLYSEL